LNLAQAMSSLSGSPELNDQEFGWFAATIQRLAGITLSNSKRELVRTRLRSQLSAHGCKTFLDYRFFLEGLPGDHPEWQVFVNLLTTNKTDFFREPRHFQYLVQEYLPVWAKSGSKSLKVWSCACSTGQEPYTLSMVLAKHLPPGFDYRILASDVDTQVLRTAENGVYPMDKLPEIPAEYANASVDTGAGEVADWFRVKEKIREKIEFRQHNLLSGEPPTTDSFDLILCRNVLIYFSREIVSSVMRNLHQAAKEQGQLFIGHSESLHGLDSLWAHKAPSIYVKSRP
jgi:chemotaxis protein methyltransferase CheR